MKTVSPTPAMIAEMARSYRSKPVRDLRTALNAYAAGTADPETMKSLAPYGVALARDRFVLDWVDRAPMGGWIMRLQFRHHMNSVYDVWLYDLARDNGDVPAVRFMLVVPCSPAQIRAINRIFSTFSALPYDG